jgi:hypothetical protein
MLFYITLHRECGTEILFSGIGFPSGREKVYTRCKMVNDESRRVVPLVIF